MNSFNINNSLLNSKSKLKNNLSIIQNKLLSIKLKGLFITKESDSNLFFSPIIWSKTKKFSILFCKLSRAFVLKLYSSLIALS